MTRRSILFGIFNFMLFLMIVTFCEGVLQMKWAFFADEVLLCISALIVISHVAFFSQSKSGRALIALLLLYTLIQLANYFMSPFQLKIIFTFGQALINLKVVIVSLAFCIIVNSIKIRRNLIRRFLNVLIFLFILGLILNIVFQKEWNLLLGWKVEYRYGFLRMAGWFGGTHYLGYFFTLVSLVLCMGYSLRRKGVLTWRFYLFYTITQIVISFPLTIRKGLVSVISLIYNNLISSNFTRFIRISIITILFGLSFYLFVGDSTYVTDTRLDMLRMTNNDDDNYYIRGLMVYNGAMLAISHFPFGVGAATFGTVLSKYNTLEVYQKVNIPSFWYEGEDLSGVYDSGFFSLLAENGFFGIIVMILIVYYLYQLMIRQLNQNGVAILRVLFVTMAIWSITEPVIQNGIFTVIFSSLCMYIISENKELESTELA
jgi:hypothetical protein